MVCAVPGVVAPGVVTAPGGGGETGFVAPPCGGRGGVDGDAADNATVDEPAGDAAWGDASPPAGDDTDVRAAGGGDSGDETWWLMDLLASSLGSAEKLNWRFVAGPANAAWAARLGDRGGGEFFPRSGEDEPDPADAALPRGPR